MDLRSNKAVRIIIMVMTIILVFCVWNHLISNKELVEYELEGEVVDLEEHSINIGGNEEIYQTTFMLDGVRFNMNFNFDSLIKELKGEDRLRLSEGDKVKISGKEIIPKGNKFLESKKEGNEFNKKEEGKINIQESNVELLNE